MNRIIQPGVLLVVKVPEYHEEIEAPYGFLELNDIVTVVEHIESDKSKSWFIMCHWGLVRKSASYLETCCDVLT